jgi:hypothetical protein
MRGGVTLNDKRSSTKSVRSRLSDFFGFSPKPDKSNPKEQSKTSEIPIIKPGELTNPDGSPFSFDDPKPLDSYKVLVEFHLRNFSVTEPIAKRDGTFDIYGYKIVGDNIRLDGTLDIPEFKEYGKFNRLKFSYFMRDGEIYIQPENLLTNPDGTQLITRIVVKSPEDSTDLITPPPVPNLFKEMDEVGRYPAGASDPPPPPSSQLPAATATFAPPTPKPMTVSPEVAMAQRNDLDRGQELIRQLYKEVDKDEESFWAQWRNDRAKGKRVTKSEQARHDEMKMRGNSRNEQIETLKQEGNNLIAKMVLDRSLFFREPQTANI